MAESRATIVIEARDQASSEFKDLTSAVTGLTTAIKDQGTATAKSGEKSKQASFDIKDLAAGFYLAKNAAAMIQGAIHELTGETVAYAEQVRDLARVTGASVEETSKLIQVADDAKVGADTLNLAFKMLIRQGIQPNIENLSKLADEYQSLQDPVKRSQFAMEKFGRAGIEMTKILELSSAEIKASADEAERLGLVMSGPAVQAARDYEKSMDNLQDTMQGLKLTIGNAVIPVITDYTDRINEQVAVSGLAKQAIDDGAASWWEANAIAQKFTMGLIDQSTATFELMQLVNTHTTRLKEQVAALTNWVDESDRALAITNALAGASGTEGIGALTAQMGDLQAIISGPLGQAAEDFKTKQDELKTKAAELSAQIGELESRAYLTGAQKEQLAGLRADLGETNGAIDANAAHYSEATKRILFNIIAQKVAQGELGDAGLKMLGDVGQAWGIYDEKTAAAIGSISTTLSNFTGTNVVDTENALIRLGGVISEDTTKAVGNLALEIDTTLSDSFDKGIEKAGLLDAALGTEHSLAKTINEDTIPAVNALELRGLALAAVLGETKPGMIWTIRELDAKSGLWAGTINTVLVPALNKLTDSAGAANIGLGQLQDKINKLYAAGWWSGNGVGGPPSSGTPGWVPENQNPQPQFGGPGTIPTRPPVPSRNRNAAHGLSMTVPPGFPNDSFLIGTTSGERVDVSPMGKGGGGSETIIHNIITLDGRVIFQNIVKEAKARGLQLAPVM